MKKEVVVKDLMPVNMVEKYGVHHFVKEWRTGDENDQTSITVWQEDLATGKVRNRGITRGCFWSEWR